MSFSNVRSARLSCDRGTFRGQKENTGPVLHFSVGERSGDSDVLFVKNKRQQSGEWLTAGRCETS